MWPVTPGQVATLRTARVRWLGARREHSPRRSVTDEQQRQRTRAVATLRAAHLQAICFVALRSQSLAFVAHRSSHLIPEMGSGTA